MARKPRRVALLGVPGAPAFVAYFRVSTEKQGRSGLGLEAQREAVERHVRGCGGTIVAEYLEIESGKKNDRPQIAAAIAAARALRATLVIAKLDRLARNVAFVSGLMEAGVEFVACDNPFATRLTIHILAAVAEHEREMISARTKAALAAVKARGVRLGNPRLKPGDAAASAHARQVRTASSQAHAAVVSPFIAAARRAGASTLTLIADALTARGIRAPGGGQDWDHTQVRRVLARLGLVLEPSADLAAARALAPTDPVSSPTA